MGTYVVKAGENIFDIALRLYGGIEGLFDLLVSNQDAISHTGLSLCDTIQPGTSLSYTDKFSVNQEIVSWFEKNGVKVRNGEHVCYRYDIGKYTEAYAKQYNLSVLAKAFVLWPSMKEYSSGEVDEKTVSDFLKYINTHSLWMEDVTANDLPALESGDYSVATDITIPSRFHIPKLIVRQAGNLSTFTYNLKRPGMMIIDWGDNSVPEMCVKSNTRVTVEHCYEDTGAHLIKIYGNLRFSTLDLRGVGGTYYPLAGIEVTNDFYSDMQSNTIINKLIHRP